MAAIIRNSSRLSLKACQLSLNSWRPGSECMVTLGYFSTLGRSGVCASQTAVLITDLRVMTECALLAGDPHKIPLHLLIFFFSGPVALSLELWVSNIASAFSLLTALQVQGYCSLGHRWPLLVNSAPVCLLQFQEEAGEKLSLRPWGASQLEAGLGVGFFSSLRRGSICHPLPLSFWVALSLSA